MRAVSAPKDDPVQVYETCVKGVTDEDLRRRLNALTSDVKVAASDYEQKARAAQLYQIPPSYCENNDLVLRNVTKKELKGVYSSYMVGKSKPARVVYDSLLSRAPLGRCPLCGLGHASTLDHYLPKSKYPLLSVVPVNLVPSCKDCNTGKSATVSLTASDQSLHPYYDHSRFVHDQWLYAEVLSTTPEVVQYFVNAPSYWDETSVRRVQAHFKEFQLAHRYSIEAANEIAERKDSFNNYQRQYGYEFLVHLLADEAKSHREKHVNSWRTALYQALVAKAWQDLSDQATDKELCNKIETCPRCSGRGEILGASCDACSGVGAAMKGYFESLGESVFEPVSCPNCIAGRLDCPLCQGLGSVPWERARNMDSEGRFL